MRFVELLSSGRVCFDAQASSKKRALEVLSETIASDESSVSARAILDCFIGRERLGSTGLEHGVAIPHGRVAGLAAPVGAFVRLRTGVDFDAADRQPVDLLFGLLVPEEATDEHLRILADLAELLSQPALRARLRACADPQEVLELLEGTATGPTSKAV